MNEARQLAMKKLRPVLEPRLKEWGLEFEDVIPALEQVDRIEDLQGGLEVSVQNYTNVMRDWLWPELFPSLTTRAGGMSVGEWRSFWVRLKTRVNSAFSDGGQMSLGRHVQQGAVGETEVDVASTAVEVADAGRAAGRAAVSHRRQQTQKPRTRDHASETDLFMVQVRVTKHGTRRVAIGKG